MFHAATRLGFHPVALLLLFRQRMASVAPFAYPVLHPIFFQRFLLTYIRAVRIRMVLDEYNSYTAFVEFQDESHDIVLVVGGDMYRDTVSDIEIIKITSITRTAVPVI